MIILCRKFENLLCFVLIYHVHWVPHFPFKAFLKHIQRETSQKCSWNYLKSQDVSETSMHFQDMHRKKKETTTSPLPSKTYHKVSHKKSKKKEEVVIKIKSQIDETMNQNHSKSKVIETNGNSRKRPPNKIVLCTVSRGRIPPRTVVPNVRSFWERGNTKGNIFSIPLFHSREHFEEMEIVPSWSPIRKGQGMPRHSSIVPQNSQVFL